MKRYGNLWQQAISSENLLHAAEQARRGKRFRPGVAAFHFNLGHGLWVLYEELATKTYPSATRPASSSPTSPWTGGRLALARISHRGYRKRLLSLA